MIEILAARAKVTTVNAQRRRASLTWVLLFLGLLGLTCIVGLLLLSGGPRPNPAIIAALIIFAAAVAIFYEPRYGVYLTLFFALVGDNTMLPWYPFYKNLSSVESLFFLDKALIFSPLEIFLVLTTISWLGRAAMQRKLDFYSGPLFWPTMVFTAFVFVGLAYGLARGGDANIALWEVRPILYMPLMLVLVSNLVTKREHVSHLLWAIMIALLIEGIVGSLTYFLVLDGDLGRTDSLTDHSAAMHLNTIFIFGIAAWLYRASPVKRIILPLMVLPVLFTYLAAQRRAAFVTLVVALIFVAIMLYKEHRQAFWLIVPPLALAGLLYLGVFWNSGGATAMPAQAIKSVIAENKASEQDRNSNNYRKIENYNSLVTIRSAPLTGVGFGNKFIVAVPMPDISFFEWWQYLTHNSIVYIWIKAGIGGFIAMLTLIGLSIMVGVRATLRMPRGDLKAAALLAVLYVIMHFIYAYVDISWDNQSMLYIGAMLGLINALEHIAAKPVPLAANRWPWQPDAQPAPGMLPISGK